MRNSVVHHLDLRVCSIERERKQRHRFDFVFKERERQNQSKPWAMPSVDLSLSSIVMKRSIFKRWVVFSLVSVKLVHGVVSMSSIVWKNECYPLFHNRSKRFKKRFVNNHQQIKVKIHRHESDLLHMEMKFRYIEN